MDLNNLNDKQLEAVKSVGLPNLIFAGAGSGKTRVLTYKIAYLIQEQGLPPDKISVTCKTTLVATFRLALSTECFATACAIS